MTFPEGSSKALQKPPGISVGPKRNPSPSVWRAWNAATLSTTKIGPGG